MEHMNFNGTKSFPHNELVDFLQKTGVKFGADINAYTSFDETVYMLQLPTDDSILVEDGYKVLEDWAHGLTFDPIEIDKERGVVGLEAELEGMPIRADGHQGREHRPGRVAVGLLYPALPGSSWSKNQSRSCA